ncbi:hypothetical protein [Azospirillum sp. SYSU D00513]|uniref:hypothetical protein n=1 Tax=Azospirillum sp. SYSU D00513 TaxID=2812561 RepID=UPI001A96635F|nr:hypothetical protein [Azospirillum sp. SYSU D00513]
MQPDNIHANGTPGSAAPDRSAEAAPSAPLNPVPAETVAGGTSLMRRLGALACALALCAGASYTATRYALKEVEVELLLRPRVIVMDYNSAAKGLASQTPEAIDRAIAEMRNNVGKLKEAGFVVLDGQSVLAAPNDLYVPTPAARLVGKQTALSQSGFGTEGEQ